MAWTASANPWARLGLTEAWHPCRERGNYLSTMLEFIQSREGLQIVAGVHLALLSALAVTGSADFKTAISGTILTLLIWAAPARKLEAVGLAPIGNDQIHEPDKLLISRRDLGLEPPSQPASDKLSDATWGELAARISHELRTPLNAIIGFSEMMDAEMLGPVGHPCYREYLGHIRDSGAALLKSTEDTLALIELLASPHTPTQADSVNLGALIRQMRTDAADVSRIADVEVTGDRRVLRQILVNLLSAARARAGAEGQVALFTRVEGSRVILVARVTSATSPHGVERSHLPLCLARTLLELQGARLIEGDGGQPGLCSWQAVTVLDRAVQPDLF